MPMMKDKINKPKFTRLTNKAIMIDIKNKQYKNHSSPSGLIPINIFHMSISIFSNLSPEKGE